MTKRFKTCGWNSVKVLFWKNMIIRRRSPVLTILEFLFPLIVALTMGLLKMQSFNEYYPNCHISSVATPSMGELAYMRSMMCNFNYTCSEENIEPVLPFGGSSSIIQDLTMIAEEVNTVSANDTVAYSTTKPLKETVDNQILFRLKFMPISNRAFAQLLESIPTKLLLQSIYSSGFLSECTLEGLSAVLTVPKDNYKDLLAYVCQLNESAKILFIINTHFKNANVVLDIVGRDMNLINAFVAKQMYSYEKFKTARDELVSSNSTLVRLQSLSTLSTFICGGDPNQNDIGRLLNAYLAYTEDSKKFMEMSKKSVPLNDLNEVKPGMKAINVTTDTVAESRDTTTCQTFQSFLSSNDFRSFSNRLYQFLYGKVIFYPATPLTMDIMGKAADQYKNFFRLAQLLKNWQNGPNERIRYNVENDPLFANIRSYLKLCSATNDQCKVYFNFLAAQKVSGYGHYTDYLDIISGISGSIGDFFLNCIDFKRKYFAVSNFTLFQELMNPRYKNLFGVRFDNLPSPEDNVDHLVLSSPQFTVTYYYDALKVDSTTNFKVLDRVWSQRPRRSPTDSAKYITSGLLDLQDNIERAIVSLVTGLKFPSEMVEPTIADFLADPFLGGDLKFMPTGCYFSDPIYGQLTNIMPMLLVLSWILLVINIAKNLVVEKEIGFKEFSRVMGLKNVFYTVSWFLTFFVSVLSISLIITMCLSLNGTFSIDSFPVFLFLNISFGMAVCMQTFFLSNFFKSSNISSVMLGIVYILLFLPFQIMIRSYELSYPLAMLTFLIPQIPYSYTIQNFINFEVIRKPLTIYKMNDYTRLLSELQPDSTILMLNVDILIYTILHLYFQELFPGKFGISQPFYFPFMPSFWRNKAVKQSPLVKTASPTEHEEVRMVNGEARYFERDPTDLTVGAEVRNLTKIYNKKFGPVVNDLSLNFYKNQVTSFLGHNGAGKTTTISILIGLYRATSGAAFIENHDINSDKKNARSMLGYCPQHNILVPNLTVREHILLFGMIKGMTFHEAELEAERFVKILGFSTKIDDLSMNLSGGQKRKLCVSLSFLGGTKVIILDEPTAGVDPYSRRSIWDLIFSMKKERTIILTTHHMDEAEVLGDRIVILSEGSVQTVGSPVYLKSKYSDGYRFLFKRNLTTFESDRECQNSSTNELLKYIRSKVVEAYIDESHPSQVILTIPPECVQRNEFTEMLESLEDREHLDRIGFSDYFVSDFSLEDIFLKVAKDPSNKKMPNKTRLYRKILNNLHINRRSVTERAPVEVNFDFEKVTGCHFYANQFRVMMKRRFMHFLRNKKGWLIEILMPLCLVLFAVLMDKFIKTAITQPKMNLNEWQMSRGFESPILKTFYADREFYLPNDPTQNTSKVYRDLIGTKYSWADTKCFQTALGTEFQPKKYDFCMGDESEWSLKPDGFQSANISCECSNQGISVCSDITFPGNTPRRYLASFNELYDLTGYDIESLLVTVSETEYLNMFGGLEFRRDANITRTLNFKQFLSKKKTVLTSLLSRLSSVGNVEDDYWYNLFNSFRIVMPPINWMRVYFNNKGYTASTAYLNKFHNLQLKSFVDSRVTLSKRFPRTKFISEADANHLFGIANFLQPMDVPATSSKNSNAIYVELTLVIFIIIAFSFLPANFVVFLVNERTSYTKQVQIISGLNRNIYWLATWVWDCVNYYITMLLIIGLFFIVNKDVYISQLNLGSFIIILVLFGPSVILLMYPASFFFKTPSSAFVSLLMINLVIGSVCTVTTFIIENMNTVSQTLLQLNNILDMIFLIFPQYCLGKGLLNIARRYFLASLIQTDSYNQYDLQRSGKFILALGVQIVVYLVFIILLENGFFWEDVKRSSKCMQRKKTDKHAQQKPALNEDVIQEAERVKMLNADPSLIDSDAVRVTDLYKKFRSKKVPAVDYLSFSVRKGECFGLLGVNGAGKSTTFKMITSIEKMDSGEILINGYSIVSNLPSALRSISYCPQFDAIHQQLTCEENLRLFGTLRGIPREHLKSIVNSAVMKMGLTLHAKKLACNLSGGNRRKLSTAVAILSDPKVILLDEPTAGMDPVAKRFLWDQVREMTAQNRSVILTSHSMEECETLCDRLGIMVKGQFKCFGTVKELKERYGYGYLVDIRVNDAHKGDSQQFNEIMLRQFDERFDFLEDHNTVLKYQFRDCIKLAEIFTGLEELKCNGVIITYSVFQSTLDHAFINFSKKEVHENGAEQMARF